MFENRRGYAVVDGKVLTYENSVTRNRYESFRDWGQVGGLSGSYTLAPYLTVEYTRVNFQAPDLLTPSGFLVDEGAAYGQRDNGYTYGWLLLFGINQLHFSMV